MSKRSKTCRQEGKAIKAIVDTKNNTISSIVSNNSGIKKVDRFTQAITNHPGAIRDLIAVLLQCSDNGNDNRIDWESVLYTIDQQHGHYFKRISVARLPMVILHNILQFIELQHHLIVFERVCVDFQRAARSYTQAWSSIQLYANDKSDGTANLLKSFPMAIWLPGIGQQRVSLITRIGGIVHMDDLPLLNGLNFGHTLKCLSLAWENDFDAADICHLTQLQALKSFTLNCLDIIMNRDDDYYQLPIVSTLTHLSIELNRPTNTITPKFVIWPGWVNLKMLDLRGFIVPVNLPPRLPKLQELFLYVHPLQKSAKKINKNIVFRQLMHSLNVKFVKAAANLSKLSLDTYTEPRLCAKIARRLCGTLTELHLYGKVEIMPNAGDDGGSDDNDDKQIADVMESLSQLTNLQVIMFPPNCVALCPAIYEMVALTTIMLHGDVDKLIPIDIKRLPRLTNIDMDQVPVSILPVEIGRVWTRSEFETLFAYLISTNGARTTI